LGLKIDKPLTMDIARVVFLVAVFTAMAIYLGRPEIRGHLFDIDRLRYMLQGGHGEFSRLASILLFTLFCGCLTSVGVPRLWVSAAAGIIYGAFMGTILSLVASLQGAATLYATGSTILSGVVERRAGKILNTWKERFQKNAFWWVLYGRLFPMSNSTLMSLICGCCKVSFKSFMLGSFLGFIPLAIVFAMFGSGGVKGNLWQIVFATTLLILSMGSRKIIAKWFPQTTGCESPH